MQKFHFYTGVTLLFVAVDNLIRYTVKFLRTVFEEDDGVHGFDFPVGKILRLYLCRLDRLILAEQKVGRVAGASLAGESITDFLGGI